jgi:3-methyladenine DNA glycosylase AlkD
MIAIPELISEIITFCQENADEAMALKYSRYFKGEFNAYGLTNPMVNAKVKEMLRRKDFTIQTVIEAAPQLFKSGKYEETSFALLLLNGLPKEFSKEVFKTIESWFSIAIHNWAHADTLAMFTLPQFIKREIITMNDFKPWLTSEYKFQRRCVPVTLIKSLKTTEDYNSIFEFLKPLMLDPVREIHQGMGWFLREAWKKKPEVTEAFLLKYKNTAARLIFQYACEKMTPEQKLKFKKEKI